MSARRHVTPVGHIILINSVGRHVTPVGHIILITSVGRHVTSVLRHFILILVNRETCHPCTVTHYFNTCQQKDMSPQYTQGHILLIHIHRKTCHPSTGTHYSDTCQQEDVSPQYRDTLFGYLSAGRYVTLVLRHIILVPVNRETCHPCTGTHYFNTCQQKDMSPQYRDTLI